MGKYVVYDASYATGEGIAMNLNFGEVIRWLWICVGIFWIAGWLGAKHTTRMQASGSRLLQLSFEIAAFYLLLAKQFPHLLKIRVLPESPTTGWLAILVAGAGALIAIWARLSLGTNWSARVTIKEQHELIRTGPYATVRHPIYSGLLLMVLGTAIEIGQVRGFVALALAFTGWYLKSRTVDVFMEQHFGGEYLQYKQKVKGLIPGIF
jgi:protein-S-isoprenylcysteine O-methyltransferase Ste14